VNRVDFHFLNVGHGDCTFVDFPSGHLTMIDVNSSKALPDGDKPALAEHDKMSLDSFLRRGVLSHQSREDRYAAGLVDPFEYYQQNFADRPIFRYIQSHPDMDHMGGLHHFFCQQGVPILNFWDVTHTKTHTKTDFEGSPHDWLDWWAYRRLQEGSLQERGHRVLRPLAGDSDDTWTDDGISVLSPNNALLSYCNRQEAWNNASIVLRIEFGGRAVILPGDAEKPAWDAIETASGEVGLKCDVLKAAHHGRQSGYSASALALMQPKVVVCSVGMKPATDASHQYRDAGAKVCSTRYCGTIRVRLYADGRVQVKDAGGTTVKRLPAFAFFMDDLW